jgi:hypothetical protein
MSVKKEENNLVKLGDYIEEVGLKVGENKNLLVKDYQDLMYSKGFAINNEETIREITTFVKHTTTAGNTRYAADVGHDDCVMTIVNTTSVFQKNDFREMVDEFSNKELDKEFSKYINDCLNNLEYTEGLDYSQVLKVRKQYQNRYKNGNSGINWFNSNR